MAKNPIYTIGYGNRSIGEFIGLLQQYSIEFLVDVRSHPYSRFNPDFSKAALEKYLKQYSIYYMFMGHNLGGRPNDDTCYLEDGRVNYRKVNEKSFYQEGIKRIQTAFEKQFRVALICSEIKPQECHRSKLIGNTLIEHLVDVAHIDEAGKLKTQGEINKFLNGAPQPSLFEPEEPPPNDKIEFSRKKYTLPSERT